jgi:replicative DNA helicase
MTKERKAKVDALVETATEAEAEPDRHRLEAAVLATGAKVGGTDEALWHGFGGLNWRRSDYDTVAPAVMKCILDKVAVHPDTVKARLTADVPDATLKDVLDPSKAVDVTVAREYIKTLSAQDTRRRALEAGREYLKKVESGNVDAAAGGLLKTVCDMVTSRGLVQEHKTEDRAAAGFMELLAARRADGRDWLGLDSGFKHLNEVLNGLTEGVFIAAGGPSTGKTTLVKQIADHVAEVEKVPVLFWSFEQSAEELRIKSLARRASVDSRVIRKGRTDRKIWENVMMAAGEYCKGPGGTLTIIEAGRYDTVEKIRAAALIAKHRAGGDKPVLIVIDYLQIMPTPEDVHLDGIKDKVDWNLSELRRLSRDLKSPVLVISSENRAGYGDNKKPTLTALKESGGIEYSADVVMCLWRDKKESEELTKQNHGRKTVRIEIHVLKNRNGELAKIMTDFTPAWATFTEGDKEDLSWSAALGE